MGLQCGYGGWMCGFDVIRDYCGLGFGGRGRMMVRLWLRANGCFDMGCIDDLGM